MSKVNMALYQKVIISLFFTLIIFFLNIRSKEAFVTQDLTEANFNKTIKENDFVLIMYYADKCPPCTKLLPDFERAGKTAFADNPPVLFAKVNCAKSFNKKLCIHITGIPVLKFYKFGRYVDDFKHKDGNIMARLARKFVLPTVEDIQSKEQYLSYLEGTTYAVIGMFAKDCKLKDAYMNVTNLMYERFDYAVTSNKDVLKYQNVRQGIVVYKPWYMRNAYEEDFSVYNDKADIDKVRYFILRNFHGIAGLRRPENKDEFTIPLLTVFYDFDFKSNTFKSTSIRNTLLSIANKYRGYLNFAISRTGDWTGLLRKFGFEDPDNTKPITIAMDINEGKYVMTEEFNRENLDDFVRMFIDNSLVPYVRSAEVPSTNDNLIFEVVARNLEDIVINTDKDTMLYIYDPDCDVCKVMKVEYRKLAEELKEEDIFFCQINGAVNDLPKSLKPVGFPTIFFLKKYKKHKPVMFYGGPRFDDLMNFVSSSSTEDLKKFDREGKRKTHRTEL